MDLFTLFAFTLAYLVAVLVPGPGVAAIVARALGGGFWSAVPMVVGILVGDLIYLFFALFGLAAIATWFAPVFVVVRWASALYLLYIAWQFWTAKPGQEQLGPRAKEHWMKTFLSGFMLTLGNPKTIVFYLALLPTVVPLDQPITARRADGAHRHRRRRAARHRRRLRRARRLGPRASSPARRPSAA